MTLTFTARKALVHRDDCTRIGPTRPEHRGLTVAAAAAAWRDRGVPVRLCPHCQQVGKVVLYATGTV